MGTLNPGGVLFFTSYVCSELPSTGHTWCRMPWEDLLLRAPPEERLAQIESALGELEFRQHAQRFTKIWAAMRTAEQVAAAAGVAQ